MSALNEFVRLAREQKLQAAVSLMDAEGNLHASVHLTADAYADDPMRAFEVGVDVLKDES